MTKAAQKDAGFSIVEVLVALTIASSAMLGVGALLHLTVRVGDAVTTSKRVHVALQDLQGLADLLDDDQTAQLQEGSALSFDLGERDQPDLATHIELTGGHDLLLNSPRGSTRAGLGTFESVGLEYLVRKGAIALRWTNEPLTSDAVALGVRLVLRLGPRVWRPLLWIAPREPAMEADA